RSISSSRPKECSTLVRDTPAFASHSLWASWRYRTTCPDLFRRDDVRTYMWLDDTRLTPGQQRVIAQIVSLGPCGVPPRQERCDLRILPSPYPEPALNCRTRAQASPEGSRVCRVAGPGAISAERRRRQAVCTKRRTTFDVPWSGARTRYCFVIAL